MYYHDLPIQHGDLQELCLNCHMVEWLTLWKSWGYLNLQIWAPKSCSPISSQLQAPFPAIQGIPRHSKVPIGFQHEGLPFRELKIPAFPVLRIDPILVVGLILAMDIIVETLWPLQGLCMERAVGVLPKRRTTALTRERWWQIQRSPGCFVLTCPGHSAEVWIQSDWLSRLSLSKSFARPKDLGIWLQWDDELCTVTAKSAKCSIPFCPKLVHWALNRSQVSYSIWTIYKSQGWWSKVT